MGKGLIMKKHAVCGIIFAIVALFGTGCSAGIEIGAVPSVTPRAEEDGKPTARPTASEGLQAPEPTASLPGEENTVAAKKNYKAQYEETGTLPSLYGLYQDKVLLGVEVSKEECGDEKRRQLLTAQFAFVSCRTELSALTVLDYEATRAAGDPERAVLDFSGADAILKYAKENGKTVRGPVLISQNMPDWFFTKDFSEEQVVLEELEDKTTKTTIELPSKEVLLARMENYIKDMMAYCNTNYPGVVSSWDVLSDAIHSDDKQDKAYRNSYWYQVLGEDYIIKAYETANASKADGQKLFYRENGLDGGNAKLVVGAVVSLIQEKSHLDGIALDINYTIQSPNVLTLENMLNVGQQTGLEIHLTQFCASTITNSRDDETRTEEENHEKAAKRYKSLMSWAEKSIEQGKYKITGIVFAGMSDDVNPDNAPKEYVDAETGETVTGVKLWNYGYLFDQDLHPKDAFFGALQDESIKAY